MWAISLGTMCAIFLGRPRPLIRLLLLLECLGALDANHAIANDGLW